MLLAGIIALDGRGVFHYVQLALGLCTILFFPGYALLSAIFPRQSDLSLGERVVLSFGFSIVVVPLLGLGLNFTPWGIRPVPVLVSLILFVTVMSCLALYGRRRLPVEKRFVPALKLNLPVFNEFFRAEKALACCLVTAVLFTVGSLIYVAATPKAGAQFTEFYILGMNRKAKGYPRDLTVGEKGKVIVGIVNHEQRMIEYRVIIRTEGIIMSRAGPIRLSHGEKWEQLLEFAYKYPHQVSQLEILLFRDQETTPYRTLSLRVRVRAE